MKSLALVLAMAVPTAAFGVGPRAAPYPCRSSRTTTATMKKWDRRKTLAETEGGVADAGFDKVGLDGTIPVNFMQGNETLTTMARPGQPLSQVAAQAGQYIKYKCGKGECGTCEVRVDGQWIRTCTVKVPYMPPDQSYDVFVRATMTKSKKSTRFFSFRSFLAGAKNNVLGMVGFVREGRKSQNAFEERLEREKAVLAAAAARKATRQKENGK